MDTETLDRLLMDRALGALPPDADALLAAYLGCDAAAATRAQEFDVAATAARRLFQEPVPSVLPPFPALGIHKVEQARQRVHVLRQGVGIAAALVVGIGLGVSFPRGLALGPTRMQPGTSGPTESRATIARETALASAGEAGPQFGMWSTQRYYENTRQTRPSAAVRLVWDSTVSLPRRGDEL
jgi:anti-sigma factor RsiW